MKEGQKLWSREELILAINLYCKLPFGKLYARNQDVKKLASLIGRTDNSVAYKLVNFASLDPSLQARGIKGASNASKLDKEIWDEFYQNWDELPYESEKLRAGFEHTTVELLNEIDEKSLPKEGKVREQMVKVRVNQSFFRRMVLTSYNNQCCITGLKNSSLLVAGHILPWGTHEKERMNPCNGLAMNALHDKAFENGLITITADYKVKVSPSLLIEKDKALQDYFGRYDGKDILLPNRFLPNTDFLKEHHLRFKS